MPIRRPCGTTRNAGSTPNAMPGRRRERGRRRAASADRSAALPRSAATSAPAATTSGAATMAMMTPSTPPAARARGCRSASAAPGDRRWRPPPRERRTRCRRASARDISRLARLVQAISSTQSEAPTSAQQQHAATGHAPRRASASVTLVPSSSFGYVLRQLSGDRPASPTAPARRTAGLQPGHHVQHVVVAVVVAAVRREAQGCAR